MRTITNINANDDWTLDIHFGDGAHRREIRSRRREIRTAAENFQKKPKELKRQHF